MKLFLVIFLIAFSSQVNASNSKHKKIKRSVASSGTYVCSERSGARGMSSWMNETCSKSLSPSISNGRVETENGSHETFIVCCVQK